MLVSKMCKCRVFSSSVVILSSLILVTSFNVDIHNYAQHRGAEDSMFGFSLATHKEQGSNWVIIGAPNAQGRGSQITRGGVVYKCPTSQDNGCDEIVFNADGSDRERKPIDDRNYQWFGATVSSAGPDLPIVACAPRYVWFTKSREERRDPVGTCYITENNFRDSSEYSPCRTSLFGYHRQGSCQAGFSAGISKDGKRLFIGAPGSWYWQGQVYSIDPNINFPFTPGIFGEAFGLNTRPKGQVIQQSLDNRPAVMSTPEGPPTDDDSYMGYSMVVGDFNNEGIQGVAVGMPKGGDALEGKVLLYTWSLTNYLNISGDQLGSYFGYALATSDVDGDLKDDLIIGAPLHAEKNNEKKYEVGRVTIAYQGINGRFTKKIHLHGFNSKSRFGLSLATLGDLNLDGYGDFAVGAPYDGPHERGAVYIFQGSASGVIGKYSQVIYAEDVQGSYVGIHPVNTFGFSLAGGLDLDGNDYPDLAVGAYLSDTAYFFRARPVVKVEAVVRFLTPNKQIFLDQKDCQKPHDRSVYVTCTDLEVCMRYSGQGVPASVEMGLTYVMDTKGHQFSPRMYLARGTGKTINASLVLFKDTQMNCLRDKVYLEEQIIDKLTELTIVVNYTLNNTGYSTIIPRDPNSILEPVVDLSTPAVASDSINIYKNCGEDNKCIPDLRLSIEQRLEQYTYEIGKSLDFIIVVANHGEDAYNAKFYVVLPNGIGFKVATRLDYTESKISCTSSVNASVFVCDLGNPLIKDDAVRFKLAVEPLRDQKLLSPTYYFHMNVTSANPELPFTLSDNTMSFAVTVWVNAVLLIEGSSVPSRLVYNVSQSSGSSNWISDIGPSVMHSYTVTNQGPSDVEGIEMFIIWPHSVHSGDGLLHLLEPPITKGADVKCDPVVISFDNGVLHTEKYSWEILKLPSFHSNASGLVEFKNSTHVPGQTGNFITTTHTVVIYYDKNNKIIHKEQIIGEPTYDQFWSQITKFVHLYKEPLTAVINKTVTIRYPNGTTTTQPGARPGTPEVPYESFKIESDISTLVSYYKKDGKLEYEEVISEEPGSVEFNDRIKSTTDRYTFPLVIRTNTTRHITYTETGGKVIYQEFLSTVGMGNTTSIQTSQVSKVMTIVFYGPDGNIVHQEIITGEPKSDVYWEQVDKIASQYTVPLTIRTNVHEVITYYENGKEIRKEEVPGSIQQAEAPFRSHTDITTTVTCYSLGGNILQQKIIPGEAGTTTYKDFVNSLIVQYPHPIIVETNTTIVINYRTSGGGFVHTGFIYKHKTETFNKNPGEISRITTTTIITFYDTNGHKLHQHTITEEPGSPEYWQQVNDIVQKYTIPVVIHTSTVKTITYYVNNVEIRKEPIAGSNQTMEFPYSTKTDIKTILTCQNMKGDTIYQNFIPGDTGSTVYKNEINKILKKYPEPITISTNTTKTVTYQAPDGHIVYTGYSHKYESHTYNQHPLHWDTVTHYSTKVVFYDNHGQVIDRIMVDHEPGTTAYWEEINKVANKYTTPVRIQTSTTKTIVYYSNGEVVKTEHVPGTIDTPYKTDVTILSTISCYDGNNQLLIHRTINAEPGSKAYNDLISNILERYTQPVSIHSNTTMTVVYRAPDNRVVYTGYLYKQEIQHYNQIPQKETTETKYTTTVIFHDSAGNVIDRITITEEPGSEAYWKQINQVISKHQAPVTIHIETTKVIIHYVNNIESHREEEPVVTSVENIPYSTQVEANTKVVCYSAHGQNLYDTTIPGDANSAAYTDLINNLISRYTQPIKIVTNTTQVITYRSSTGRVIYKGYIYSGHTQTYHQNQQETSKITTITVVSFYNGRGDFLQKETITEEPGTPAYWEEINRVINKYGEPVTIRSTITTVVTYYVNGLEVRKEEKPHTSHPFGVPYTTTSEISTVVTCYDNTGVSLYQNTVPGDTNSPAYNSLVSSIVSRYTEPITITSNTTKTIVYRGTDGRVVHTGYLFSQKTHSYHQGQGETSRISTITIVKFYDRHNNLLKQITIMDEPGTPAYWEQINMVVVMYHHETLTIDAKTKKVITYYDINGREIRSEQVPGAAGPLEDPFTSYLDIQTIITVYNNYGHVLDKQTLAGDRRSDAYNVFMVNVGNSYREAITIHSNTTKTITYRNDQGQTLHTGYIIEKHTEHRKPTQPETSTTTIITIISFYGNSGNFMHKETIRDEPGSPAYWDFIKNYIVRVHEPVQIYTNTTKVITYYVNGVEIRTQQVPSNAGIYERPFTAQVDIVNVITFYGSNRQILNQETITGELTKIERNDRLITFTKTHPGVSFTMETNTTKTITYRGSDGRVIYNDMISVPTIDVTDDHNKKVVTHTTFIVYDGDGHTELYRHTITGEQGSPEYNDFLANLISRFPPPITIRTNTTKVITHYNSAGQSLNEETLSAPWSTIQRGSTSGRSDAVTRITFYGPDGKPIHRDSVKGAPGPQLYDQLGQIAKKYGGVVTTQSRTVPQEGSVTQVDTPYPGHKPEVSGKYFQGFDNYNREHQYNQSVNRGSNTYNRNSYNLQHFNDQDLGSFAKGKGFTVGGSDHGFIDRNLDDQARERFERHNSRKPSNVLGDDTIEHQYRHLKRHKREIDSTDQEITDYSNCATSNCIAVKCTSGPLQNGHEIQIALRARVNLQTLKSISTTNDVQIQSLMLARISKFQNISGHPAQRTLYRQAAISTVVAPEPEIKPHIVPLWVVVLSAVAGTLILLLLIFLLYKVGFFKRNRPSDAPERQPLNRNGHFQHGDEAL